eukprot:2430353-Prymnesium_polylepis.1
MGLSIEVVQQLQEDRADHQAHLAVPARHVPHAHDRMRRLIEVPRRGRAGVEPVVVAQHAIHAFGVLGRIIPPGHARLVGAGQRRPEHRGLDPVRAVARLQRDGHACAVGLLPPERGLDVRVEKADFLLARAIADLAGKADVGARAALVGEADDKVARVVDDVDTVLPIPRHARWRATERIVGREEGLRRKGAIAIDVLVEGGKGAIAHHLRRVVRVLEREPRAAVGRRLERDALPARSGRGYRLADDERRRVVG